MRCTTQQTPLPPPSENNNCQEYGIQIQTKHYISFLTVLVQLTSEYAIDQFFFLSSTHFLQTADTFQWEGGVVWLISSILGRGSGLVNIKERTN